MLKQIFWSGAFFLPNITQLLGLIWVALRNVDLLWWQITQTKAR